MKKLILQLILGATLVSILPAAASAWTHNGRYYRHRAWHSHWVWEHHHHVDRGWWSYWN